VITPSQKRLEHMRQAVTIFAFSPAQTKRLLWGTIQEQATKELLFETIWQSMDADDDKLYRIG
jgi:hypothetical protein